MLGEDFDMLHLKRNLFKNAKFGLSLIQFQINETVSNISMDYVKYYINQCQTCALKVPQYLKSSLKPIISNNFMDRMQVRKIFSYLYFTNKQI